MPLIISKDEARTMNAQEGSRFFSIPIELRHAIYSNAFQFAERHLRCVTEKDGSRCFRLTPCTEPVMPSADAATNGWERNPSNEWQDPIFQRRLASSWGPHWACEELALNLWYIDQQREENARNLCSALRVCKKIYLDIITVAAPATRFHVTDLRTLAAMLNGGFVTAPFSFEVSICPRIDKLSLMLNAPLALFHAVEDFSISRDDQVENPRNDEAEIWACLLPSRLFSQLPQIRRLGIWLDLTTTNMKARWGVVNERAFLAPVQALKTSNPELELTCALPKLHPRLENVERHYLPDFGDGDQGWPASRLGIHRFVRERFRAEVKSNELETTYVNDFPELVDSMYFEHKSMADKEEMERRMFGSGLWIHQGDGFPRFLPWPQNNRPRSGRVGLSDYY